MGIYSANRSGMMEAGSIAVNENYTSNDLGRIMYESQVNDMAIFEAIIASDLQEAKAIQEGTLLESEAVKFNRQNATGILGKLEERLKYVWGKIKAALKDAMNKIAAYVLRDGKAFAKEFRKKFAGKKIKEPVKTSVFNDQITNKISTLSGILKMNDISVTVDKYAKDADMVKSNEIIRKLLGEELSDFMESFRSDLIIDGTVSQSDVERLLKTVEDGKKEISATKSFAARLDKDFKDSISYIRSLSKAKARDDEDYKIKNATAACSAFEKISSALSKVQIMAIKAEIKQARVNLSAILSEAVNESAVLAEAAALDAEAEVDDAMSPEVSVEIEEDPELKDAVEDVVDSPEVDNLAECLH